VLNFTIIFIDCITFIKYHFNFSKFFFIVYIILSSDLLRSDSGKFVSGTGIKIGDNNENKYVDFLKKKIQFQTPEVEVLTRRRNI
jgi:hypothetical protein